MINVLIADDNKGLDISIFNMIKCQNLENIDKNKRQVEIINGEIINLKNTIAYLESKITNVDMYINKITDIYYEFKENLSSEIFPLCTYKSYNLS